MTDTAPKRRHRTKADRTKPVVNDYGRTLLIEHRGTVLRVSRRAFKNLISAIQHGRFNYSRPGYKAIADWLRSLIASGEIPYGSRLPTEDAISQMWNGLHRKSIRRAYQILQNEGLCQVRHGHGRYVRYPDDHTIPAPFRVAHGPGKVDRVVQRIRDLVDNNFFPDGHELPAVPEIAKMFATDVPRMRRALWQLEAAGYVTRRPGRTRIITHPGDNPSDPHSLDTPCATSSTRSASPDPTAPTSSSASPPAEPTPTPRRKNPRT